MPRMHIDRIVDVTSETWDIERLKFDPNNVRLAHISASKRPKSPDEIAAYLWGHMGDNIKRLYASIVNSRGLHEELYVMPDGTVVEGNERLTCLWRAIRMASEHKLNGINPEVFKRVEVKVFPEGTPERTIKIFLARLHVVGKDEWKLINQAQLVGSLVDEIGQEETATQIGMSKTTVNQLVKANKTFDEFRERFSDEADADPELFSYFVELHKAKALAEWLEQKDANRNHFFLWVASHKLNATGAKDCRRLMEVLNDADANAAFVAPGGDMKRALLVLDSKDLTFGSTTLKAAEKLHTLLLEMGTD
jgi:hypothetical protein